MVQVPTQEFRAARRSIRRQFEPVEEEIRTARGTLKGQEEELARKERELAEARKSAKSFRVPQRTVETQFALGQQVFAAERAVPIVRKRRERALQEISSVQKEIDTAQAQVSSSQKRLEEQASKIEEQKRKALANPLRRVEIRQTQTTPEGFVGASTQQGEALVPVGGSTTFVPTASRPTGEVEITPTNVSVESISRPVTISSVSPIRQKISTIAQAPEQGFQKVISSIGQKSVDLGLTSEEKRFETRITKPSVGLGLPSPISFGKRGGSTASQLATPFSSRQAVETTADVGTFLIPGVREARVASLVSSTGGKVVGGERVSIPEAVTTASLVAIPALRFLRKPVRIRTDPVTRPTFESRASVVNLRRDQRALADIAEFEVRGTRPARRAFETTRGDVLRSQVFGLGRTRNLASLSDAQLVRAFPRGRFIEIERASAVVTKTEPFIVKGGQIVAPVRPSKSGVVAAVTQKGTLARREPIRISQIEGSTALTSRDINLLRKNQLDPISRKQLEAIEDLSRSRDVRVTRTFPKGTQFTKGEVKTTDLVKVSSRGDVKIIPEGRRIRRGDIGAVQESKAKVQFPDEFGVTEKELLSDRIAVLDTTFPRLRSPRDKLSLDVLEGSTTRTSINLPSPPSPPSGQRFPSPPKRSRPLIQEQEATTKSLQKQIGSVVLQQKALLSKPVRVRTPSKPSTRTVTSTPRSTTLTPQLIETTVEPVRLPPSASRSVARGSQTSINLQVPTTSQVFKTAVSQRPAQVGKLDVRTAQRSVSRQLSRDTTRLVSRQSSRNIIKQTQRTSQRQTSRQVSRTVTRTPPRRILSRFSGRTPRSTTPFIPVVFARTSGKTSSALGVSGSSKNGFTPSVVGSVRFNVLGETITKKRAKKISSLPFIRGVIR